MALTVSTLRAFKEVPRDIRQWSRWIREALTEAITGTVELSLIESIATDSVLGRATAGTGAVEVLTCTAAGRALLDDAAASNQRTTLGLGTSATVDTGTSGTKVPLLDGANAWSLPQIGPSYTVAGLPSAATYNKARAIVTDANATTFAAVVAGGGANVVPVYSDGTNWRIG